ncbi:MAG: hypothetical protein JO215_13070 [Ktedonobacteraceae bacterium]|nr:hypothetical protein [Ktedonobacteraceae bacterium]
MHVHTGLFRFAAPRPYSWRDARACFAALHRVPTVGDARACFAALHRAPTALVNFIGRVGWWAQRASEGHPYTIGNHQMKAVSPLLLRLAVD